MKLWTTIQNKIWTAGTLAISISSLPVTKLSYCLVGVCVWIGNQVTYTRMASVTKPLRFGGCGIPAGGGSGQEHTISIIKCMPANWLPIKHGIYSQEQVLIIFKMFLLLAWYMKINSEILFMPALSACETPMCGYYRCLIHESCPSQDAYVWLVSLICLSWVATIIT